MPGAGAVAARPADILFIQVVRAYLVIDPGQIRGQLRGMTDPAVGRALALLHADPAQPWSVEGIAERVGMSRSGSAARFKPLVGQSPIACLTHCGMHRAAGRLLAGNLSIVEMAEVCGYRSEVAFSGIFERWTETPPAAYRRANGDRSCTHD